MDGSRRFLGPGWRRPLVAVVAAAAIAAVSAGGASAHGGRRPKPGTPAYFERDNRNMKHAYGRQTGPHGQLDPSYVQALGPGTNPGWFQQIADQLSNPTRPVLDPGQWFPGWNAGNVWRQ